MALYKDKRNSNIIIRSEKLKILPLKRGKRHEMSIITITDSSLKPELNSNRKESIKLNSYRTPDTIIKMRRKNKNQQIYPYYPQPTRNDSVEVLMEILLTKWATVTNYFKINFKRRHFYLKTGMKESNIIEGSKTRKQQHKIVLCDGMGSLNITQLSANNYITI